MTSNHPTMSDTEYLDSVFDLAVHAAENGIEFNVKMHAAGHEHLESELVALARLAQQVASGPDGQRLAIAGYTIVQELGSGGMGNVYLARQERLAGRLVALKTLPPGVALSTSARTRFRSEANAIARLTHPNIITIHDVIDQAEIPAYAMEWIDGSTWAALIQHVCRTRGHLGGNESKSLPPIETVREFLGGYSATHKTYAEFCCGIGAAMARALGAVHRAGLLHRDVKPSNILLRQDGTPVLSDFGLVRDRDNDPMLTKNGAFAGTPAYAAPEQLRGETAAIDGRTDVYALGVTLYHALALRPPYPGNSAVAVLRGIESGLAAPLRRLCPRIDQKLAVVVAKAMSPDPRHRYQTADALADDLDRVTRHEPIHARGASAWARVTGWVRRRRGLAAGVALGVFATIFALSATTVARSWAARTAAESLRMARLALLNPNYTEIAYSAEFGEGPLFQSECGVRWLRQTPSRCLAALARYDAAADANPNAADRQSMEIERQTVALAYGVLCAWSGFTTEFAARVDELKLATIAPGTLRVARAWVNARQWQSVEKDALAIMDRRDLMCLSLLAYLCCDGRLMTAAYFAGGFDDDATDLGPLLDAILGDQLLVSPVARGTVRLLEAASREFPEAGYLRVALADAYVRVHRVAEAEALLQEALTVGMLDSFQSHVRVRADIDAWHGFEARSRGDTRTMQACFKAADDGYERMCRLTRSPTARLNYAMSFIYRHEPAKAIVILHSLLKRWGQVPMYHLAYVQAVEAWWRGLPPDDRVSALSTSAIGDVDGVPIQQLRIQYDAAVAFLIAGGNSTKMHREAISISAFK